MSKYYILLNRDYEKGIAEAERAVLLEPSSADAYSQLGNNLFMAGRCPEAIPILQKALRLSSIPPQLCLITLAGCYRFTGRQEESIALYRSILQKEPNQMIAQLNLCFSLLRAGKEDEARAEAEKVLRIDPKFSGERYAEAALISMGQSAADAAVKALRKLGLK